MEPFTFQINEISLKCLGGNHKKSLITVTKKGKTRVKNLLILVVLSETVRIIFCLLYDTLNIRRPNPRHEQYFASSKKKPNIYGALGLSVYITSPV